MHMGGARAVYGAMVRERGARHLNLTCADIIAHVSMQNNPRRAYY